MGGTLRGTECFTRVAVPTGDVLGLTHYPLQDRFSSCALLCCHRDPRLGGYAANPSFSSAFYVGDLFCGRRSSKL